MVFPEVQCATLHGHAPSYHSRDVFEWCTYRLFVFCANYQEHTERGTCGVMQIRTTHDTCCALWRCPRNMEFQVSARDIVFVAERGETREDDLREWRRRREKGQRQKKHQQVSSHVFLCSGGQLRSMDFGRSANCSVLCALRVASDACCLDAVRNLARSTRLLVLAVSVRPDIASLSRIHAVRELGETF